MTIKIGIIGPANFHTLRIVHMLKEARGAIVLFASYYQVFRRLNSDGFINELKKHSTIEPFSILNPVMFVKAFRELSAKADVLIISSLHPIAMIYLLIIPLRTPVIYVPFGSDWKGSFVKRIIIKTLLSRFHTILVEFNSIKTQMCELHGISPQKFKKTIIWPIGAMFNPTECVKGVDSIHNLKSKWEISEKLVILSPRALVPLYNHHVLLHAVSLLPEWIRLNTRIVLIDFSTSPPYKRALIKLIKKLGVKATIYPGPLTPEQLKELYQTAEVSINIPKSDQFGASLMEAALCGLPQVINQEIKTYSEKFSNFKNCIFVEPEPKQVARALGVLLSKPKLRKKMSHRTRQLFVDRTDKKMISMRLLDTIREGVLNETI